MRKPNLRHAVADSYARNRKGIGDTLSLSGGMATMIFGLDILASARDGNQILGTEMLLAIGSSVVLMAGTGVKFHAMRIGNRQQQARISASYLNPVHETCLARCPKVYEELRTGEQVPRSVAEFKRVFQHAYGLDNTEQVSRLDAAAEVMKRCPLGPLLMEFGGSNEAMCMSEYSPEDL